MTKSLTVCLLILLLHTVPAQADWEPWQPFLGEWKASGSGRPGQSTAELSFHAELGGKVLVRRNHNQYGKGQVHEDLLIVRPSTDPNKYFADYYDNEGHYIRYECASVRGSMVLTSIDRDGPRFRLTLEPRGADRFFTRFEIAAPGKPFATYTEGEATRVK